MKQHSNIIQKKKLPNSNSEITDIDRENFYHWGATREIMDIIRKRNKSPETRRLVELRNALSKPGTLRRRYDPHTQRTIFAPTRPNKRSREEIVEIDAELLQRTHRLGGGYHPLTEDIAIDPELTRVRASMRREERETTPEGYRPVFDKLSIRWGLVFMDDQIVVRIDLRRRLLDILHFGHAGTTKMIAEAKIFWWPDINRDIENKVKDCIACLASGKKLKYQLPKNHYGKPKTLTEPGQEIQIDFTGKLHNKRINGDVQISIAVDRFSKWPTVKICKTAETKEVFNFLANKFNLYGIPEKIKSDKGGAFISKEYREFCKYRNIEIEYCTPRLHRENGAVERAIQTLKNIMLTNLEEGTDLTESVN